MKEKLVAADFRDGVRVVWCLNDRERGRGRVGGAWVDSHRFGELDVAVGGAGRVRAFQCGTGGWCGRRWVGWRST
jgi:hypothetical protein